MQKKQGPSDNASVPAQSWQTEHSVVFRNDYSGIVSSDFSLTQKRMLYFLLSQIDGAQDSFHPITVTFNEFLRIIGSNSRGGGDYKHVLDTLNGLQSKPFYVFSDNRIEAYPWFVYFQVDTGTPGGKLTIEFNPYLMKYFLRLTKNFTIVHLQQLLRFRMSPSIDLYNLFRSFLFKGTLDVEVDELRRILGHLNEKTGVDRYSDRKSFFRWLRAWVQEINDSSDLAVTFTPIKSPQNLKQIKGFHFIIKKNPHPNVILPKLPDIKSLP